MKNTIVILSLFTLLLSCNKKCHTTTQSTLTGTWKLTEVLADPGDGSGTFNAVNSNKTIIFNNNGTLSSNGLICNMSIESSQNSTANYFESDSTIISSSCPNQTIKYEAKGNVLILIYPCIEACKAKYIRRL